MKCTGAVGWFICDKCRDRPEKPERVIPEKETPA